MGLLVGPRARLPLPRRRAACSWRPPPRAIVRLRSDVAVLLEGLPRRARERGLPPPQDRDALRAVVGHERKLRDRTNILISENKVPHTHTPLRTPSCYP